ncbi:MAG: tRNA-intron lyase [Thermoprotei archaeon]|nr:MAG: tRNA-intron lyase [Thermoprotei archaeon]
MKVPVYIIGAKAVLFDKEAGNKLLQEFYGRPLAERKPRPGEVYDPPFTLSLYEALYLCEKGVVEPVHQGHRMGCEELRGYAESTVPGFRYRYAVYRDLRSRGYIVRSGLRFGADFTVYEVAPGIEHAPYVILVSKRNELVDPISIVRIGRVSHSVRKRLVLAVVDEDCSRIEYIIFKWVKL